MSIAAVLLTTSALLTRGEPRYSVTFIPSLGGAMCDGYDINERGQVAGLTSLPGAPTLIRAFLYTNGVIQNLGALPGMLDTTGLGINAAGDIVGYGADSGPARAFLYHTAQMTDLGVLGGDSDSSYATAVNDWGEVVGVASIGQRYHAFLYTAGKMTDVGSRISIYDSRANDINNAGQIVGYFTIASGKKRAFLYTNGQTIDFSPSAEADCSGVGINEKGQAVGYGASNAFIYSGGVTSNLPLNEAYAINNVGQIAGSTYVETRSGGFKHAFIFQDGKAEDLNDLIAQKPRWVLYEARAINDAGQIVGRGTSIDAGSGTFLLTPIPSSTSGIEIAHAPKTTSRASIVIKGRTPGVVTKVLYRVGQKGPYKAAKGTNAWQFRAKLAIGRNRIMVIIQRPAGRSKPKSFFIVRTKT